MLMDKSAAESRRELNSKRRELEKAKRRIEELDRIFWKLYEDRINGIRTDQRFELLSQGYEQEQKELTAKTEQLEREIQESGEKAVHVDRFLAIVHKYTDIRELTPVLLREFIQRIEVHERSVYCSPKATQQVDIYYNFVGMLPEAPETEE